MKRIKQFAMAALAFTFLLSSCAVEKRVHLSGYHIDWKKNKHNSHKIEAEQNYTDNQEKFETKIIEETIATTTPENLTDNNLSASTENSIVVPKTVKIDLNKKVVKTAIKNALKTSEGRSVLREVAKGSAKNSNKKSGGDISMGLLYVLCVFVPMMAVGYATKGDINIMFYNLLWSLLCGIPGIIHAFVVVSREM